MHYTITYAYFGESFEDYVAAQKELDNYGERQAAVKDLLFALHGIAMYPAYIAALGEFTVRLCITALHIYMLWVSRSSKTWQWQWEHFRIGLVFQRQCSDPRVSAENFSASFLYVKKQLSHHLATLKVIH